MAVKDWDWVNSPCHCCTERQLHCHSKCGKYLNYKQALEAVKECVRKQKDIEVEYTDYVLKAMRRSKGRGIKIKNGK